jgi:hypothetical protein
MNSSILRRIWLNFMAQYLFFSALKQFSQFCFRISNFFGAIEETYVVEMHIWCVKIGIVLFLHIIIEFCYKGYYGGKLFFSTCYIT